MAENTPLLEERLVMFADILGFQEMVKDAVSDQTEKAGKRVSEALGRIRRLTKNGSDHGKDIPQAHDLRVHNFSDSIYLSVPKEPNAVVHLIEEVAKLTVDLMSMGVWLRGGLALGLVSSDKETPWGPALIEAYNVESTLAKYPRIAMSSASLKLIQHEMGSNADSGLISRGKDGVFSISPMAWIARNAIDQRTILSEMKMALIRDELNLAYEAAVANPSVFEKVNWLCDRWDEGIDKMKADSKFRTTAYATTGLHDVCDTKIWFET
jgi:hypothetical protein